MAQLERKGAGVIYQSSYELQDFVGSWNTSVTADGTMSDEMLVLLPDGTGFVAEANCGPYYRTPIAWFVEFNILTISNAERVLSHKPVHIEKDVVIPCYSNEEKHFTALCDVVYGLDFYRSIGGRTLDEGVAEAQAGVDFLLKFGGDDNE
jgi:hypothetical protein